MPQRRWSQVNTINDIREATTPDTAPKRVKIPIPCGNSNSIKLVNIFLAVDSALRHITLSDLRSPQ